MTARDRSARSTTLFDRAASTVPRSRRQATTRKTVKTPHGSADRTPRRPAPACGIHSPGCRDPCEWKAEKPSRPQEALGHAPEGNRAHHRARGARVVAAILSTAAAQRSSICAGTSRLLAEERRELPRQVAPRASVSAPASRGHRRKLGRGQCTGWREPIHRSTATASPGSAETSPSRDTAGVDSCTPPRARSPSPRRCRVRRLRAEEWSDPRPTAHTVRPVAVSPATAP